MEDSPGPAEQEAVDRPERRGRFVLPLAVVLLTIAVLGVGAFLLLGEDEATVAASPPSLPITVEPNTVVELDPSSGKVLASFDVGVDPERVALAGDDVWVLNSDAGTVSRVDEAGGDVETIDSVPEVRALAASDTDGVWVVGFRSARRQAAGGRRLFRLSRGADAPRGSQRSASAAATCGS